MKFIFECVKALIAIAAIAGLVYLFNQSDQTSLKKLMNDVHELTVEHFPHFGDPDQIASGQEPAPPQVQILPANGLSHTVASGTLKHSVQIINRSKDQHSMIKIEEAYSGRVISKHFVRANDRIDIKVPDGEFRIKVATGVEWYGEPYLFGPDTNAYQLAKTFKYDKYQKIIYYAIEINLPSYLINQSPDIIKGNIVRNEKW